MWSQMESRESVLYDLLGFTEPNRETILCGMLYALLSYSAYGRRTHRLQTVSVCILQYSSVGSLEQLQRLSLVPPILG